jgi:tetratricopeptide (TPR) repeat protein
MRVCWVYGFLLVFLCACPRAGEEHLRKGHAYFASGDLKKAALAYEAAAEANPKSARGPEARGNVAFEEGDLELAETWYRKALTANPRHVTSRHKLALSLASRGVFDEAIVELKKSIEIAPDNPYALSVLGGLYKNLGKFAQAEAMQLKALDVDDNYHAARYALGNLLVDSNRLADAERQFEILMTKSQTALAEYGFARLAAKKKDSKRAAEHLQHVLASEVSAPARILKDPVFTGLWSDGAMKAIFTRLSTATSTSS